MISQAADNGVEVIVGRPSFDESPKNMVRPTIRGAVTKGMGIYR
jgi:hypothetical protein